MSRLGAQTKHGPEFLIASTRMNSCGDIARCGVPSRHGVCSFNTTWLAAWHCRETPGAPGRVFGLCDCRLHRLSMAGRPLETATQEQAMNIETPPARQAARSQRCCRLARVQRC
jgi:hypothetical protein